VGGGFDRQLDPQDQAKKDRVFKVHVLQSNMKVECPAQQTRMFRPVHGIDEQRVLIELKDTLES